MAITQSLYTRLDGLRKYAGSLAWGPLTQLSRTAILSVLQKTEIGQLKITDTSGELIICGQSKELINGPRTELRIHKDTFWVRMLLFADMVGPQSHLGAMLEALLTLA